MLRRICINSGFFFEVCIKLEFKHKIVIQKGENVGKEGELALNTGYNPQIKDLNA